MTNFGKLVVAGVLVVLGGIGSGMYYLMHLPTPTPHACTLEAKICPDGTAVGRTGPTCEFAACPSIEATSTMSSQATSTATSTTNTALEASSSTTH